MPRLFLATRGTEAAPTIKDQLGTKPRAVTAIVLLPGSDGTGVLFEPFIRATSLECIRVKYPTGEALGYPSLTEIASEYLPTDRPFVLLGESFSGPIAINLAASRPQGLAGLILSASFARCPYPALAWTARFSHLFPVRLPTALLAQVLMGVYATPELERSLRHAIGLVDPQVMRTRMKAVLKVNSIPDLKRVKVPALYLRATEDRVIPKRMAEDFVSHVTAGEVVDIRAPHFLLQCRPGAAAETIGRFVSDLKFNG